MHRFNLISGLFALCLFGVAQYQGWNLFDNTAGTSSHAGGGSGGRIYHK